MFEAAASPPRCGACGAEIPPSALACVACHALVHAEELKRLAASAEAAEQRGLGTDASAAWRRALELLPLGSHQHAAVQARLGRLDVPAAKAAPPSSVPKILAGLGAAGLLLWKLKFVLVFAATKAKFLLLGLTKLPTLLSMFLAVGAYWTVWGWKFALGFVLCIYIHEMGHVAAARSLGIPVTAPLFIPGLGAFIRLKQHFLSPKDDARMGLAGPWWGLFAALGLYGAGYLWDWRLGMALAHVGAWINLFNLLPVWTLDGGRGFNGMSRAQRWVAVAVLAGTWFYTAETMVLVVGVAAAVRALMPAHPEGGKDKAAVVQYCTLVIALGSLCAATAQFDATRGLR